MAFHLRFKFYIVLVPFVLIVMFISGFLGIHVMRLALTRSANHHMAFKAEQMRDYFYNEWNILNELGLTDTPEYRYALERSFRSYTFSLLRSDTEQVAVIGPDDTLVMLIQRTMPEDEEQELFDGFDIPESGWFETVLLDEARVGVSFQIAPFSWTVALSETEQKHFSGINMLQKVMLTILLGSLTILAVFVFVLVGLVTRPVERLTSTIMNISLTADYTKRAVVEQVDEIGMLANEFNNLVSKVSSEHTQLEQMIHHEASAREIAVQREEEALTVLGRVSDFRDEETGQHQRRIGRVSALFGTYLGMTVADQRKLLYGAPLHDIGKIAIPDAILQKPGPLTEEEMAVMKTHPMIGFELLKETRGKYLAEGATIALTHHEKWDGTGYPNGLAGEKTPLSGRIVGLADVLDALFSERVYKRAWSVSEVMDYVQEQKGKHFDPRLVDVFLEHKELFLQVLLEK